MDSHFIGIFAFLAHRPTHEHVQKMHYVLKCALNIVTHIEISKNRKRVQFYGGIHRTTLVICLCTRGTKPSMQNAIVSCNNAFRRPGVLFRFEWIERSIAHSIGDENHHMNAGCGCDSQQFYSAPRVSAGGLYAFLLYSCVLSIASDFSFELPKRLSLVGVPRKQAAAINSLYSFHYAKIYENVRMFFFAFDKKKCVTLNR